MYIIPLVMTALTLLAIWLLIGLVTAVIVFLTSQVSLTGDMDVLGLLIALGPVGGLLIVDAEVRRLRSLRRLQKQVNQDLRKAYAEVQRNSK